MKMERKLKALEISVLVSADEAGQVAIPCGSATEIQDWLDALLRLERAGCVSRVPGNAYYRPFALTAEGRALKSELLLKQPPLIPAAY